MIQTLNRFKRFFGLAEIAGIALLAMSSVCAWSADRECVDANGIPERLYTDSNDGKTYRCDVFENAIFSGAKTKNFPKDSFKGATIDWSTFRLSQLQKFDFSNVTIKNSIFYGANLTEATISGSISDSVFGSACFCGTDLRQAQFKDSKFLGVKYDEHTQFPPEMDEKFRQKWKMELRVDCEQSCFTPEKKPKPEELEPEELPPGDIAEVLRRKVPKKRRRERKQAPPLQDRLEICLAFDRSGSMDSHYKALLAKFQGLEDVWTKGFPRGVKVNLVEVANGNQAPTIVLRGAGMSDLKAFLTNIQPSSGSVEPMIDAAMLCASTLHSHKNPFTNSSTKRVIFVATDLDGESTPNNNTRPELEKMVRDMNSDLDWVNMDLMNSATPPPCPKLLESGLDVLAAVQQVEQLVVSGRCQDSVHEYLRAKLPGTLPPVDPKNPALIKLFHLSLLKQPGLEEEHQEALVELLLDPALRSIALHGILGRNFVPGRPVLLTDQESRKLLIEILVYLEAADAFGLIQEFNLIRGKKQLYDWLEDDELEPNVKDGILKLLTEMDGQQSKSAPQTERGKSSAPKQSAADLKFRQKIIELLDSDDPSTRENALTSFIQIYNKDRSVSKLILDKAAEKAVKSQSGFPSGFKDQAFLARIIGSAKVSEAAYLLYALLKNPDLSVQIAAIEAMGELDAIVENSPKDALTALLPKLSEPKLKAVIVPVLKKIYQQSKFKEAGSSIMAELETWMNRVQAIQVIVNLKLREGIPYLWKAFGDGASASGPAQAISNAALTALVDFEVPELKEKMFGLVRDPGKGVLARSYLGRTLNLQNAQEVSRLVQVYFEIKNVSKGQNTLSTEDQNALAWLKVKLKSVRTKASLPFWKDFAKSVNPMDRLEALRVFDDLNEIDAIKTLFDEDPDRDVRANALAVLKSKKIEIASPLKSANASSYASGKVGKNANAVGTVSDTDFNSLVLQSKEPVLVKFTAGWCGPCITLKPILEKLAADYTGRLKIVELDVDQNQNTVARFQASKLPTLILFQNGLEKSRWVGANDIDFYRWQLDRFLGAKQ